MRSAPAAKTQQPKPAKYKDSCDNCAQSKVKCNRAKPECQRCIRNGIECHYSLARRGKARLLYPEKSAGSTKQSSSSSLLTPPGPSTPDQQDHHLSSTHLYETDTLGLAAEQCELAADLPALAEMHPPVITSASCCEDVGIHMSTPGSMSSACGSAGRLAWCNPELTLYPGQQGVIPNDTSINQTGEPVSPGHHVPATALPLHWTNFQFPADIQSAAGSNGTTLQFIDPMLTPSSMTATLFGGVSTAKHHPPEIPYQATTSLSLEAPQHVCQGYQSCASLAMSTYESLQVPKAPSCAPIRNAAPDYMAGRVPLSAARRSTDVVLRASRAAMENVATILKCPCGGASTDNSTSSLSILLLLVCSSVVDAFQRIPIIRENMSSGYEGDDLELDQQHQNQDVDVGQLMSEETPQSCTSEMGGMDVDVPIAIGGYVLDGHAKRKAISSVLLSQLYEVGETIEKVSSEDSQAQVMGCSMPHLNARRGSTGEMVMVLKSLLMTRLRATIISVKAEAEF
ncbi:uncharacterized protein E0L32_000381 [Thyridium curvatum]|uniref:Zn(2)-C6 fungal-type domain-containing protein n=1 Tax=Thyridium curvatum TaxID=1093900 RepID=A0A507B898_9PEZI|nr:uncharacterized protein E0L32_000381 [Thyridium curvatum]TPX16047.1 hypothetical protein E0L32_000381 [Thyridium curvatum]